MEQIEQRISSIEVAEMIGKEHKVLLRDIRRYCEQLGENNIVLSDFFEESTYITAQNKEMPCYNVTKKGCEFIAHKITGVKGTEFTAKYINRFHQMEDMIRTRMPHGKELLAIAVLEAQRMIEQQNEEIERMKQKEIFADAVAASSNSILIGELAKLISQSGKKIGQNQLFHWMRENGYLARSGERRNLPNQKYVDQGLFEIKERTINNPNGSIRTTFTTKVTGKGQQYFINKFFNKKDLPK